MIYFVHFVDKYCCGTYKLSFETICIEIWPFVVFLKENKLLKYGKMQAKISKNCNWKGLVAFFVNYFDKNHWRTLQALIWDHLQHCCIIWRPSIGKKVVTSKWFHNNKSGIKWKDGMSLNHFDKNSYQKIIIKVYRSLKLHFCPFLP